VVLMTDADLCARDSLFTRREWEARIQHAPHTCERTGGRVLAGDPKVLASHTSHTERPWGRGWLAAGDATFSFDPLSGDGVYRALRQGMRAAETIDRSSRGDGGPLAEYGEELAGTLNAYLETLREYYSREARWPDAPFWVRRHSKRSWPPERSC
jgi:flavin-dependent dehydrogenase